jgi:septum formation protein
MPIVLASASPRRQELLRNAGITFSVHPAEIDETPRRDEPAQQFAERMAREKAEAIRQQFPEEKFILGADTVVVVDNLILGKPEDAADAARMLRLLSGREHQVITGVCLMTPDLENVRSEITTVHFCAMTEDDIRSYIASGEPMDKAGAYAIQGGAARWILKVEGDYNNVVGLPLDLVGRMLRDFGAL